MQDIEPFALDIWVFHWYRWRGLASLLWLLLYFCLIVHCSNRRAFAHFCKRLYACGNMFKEIFVCWNIKETIPVQVCVQLVLTKTLHCGRSSVYTLYYVRSGTMPGTWSTLAPKQKRKIIASVTDPKDVDREAWLSSSNRRPWPSDSNSQSKYVHVAHSFIEHSVDVLFWSLRHAMSVVTGRGAN